jgi:hypothetical protein
MAATVSITSWGVIKGKRATRRLKSQVLKSILSGVEKPRCECKPSAVIVPGPVISNTKPKKGALTGKRTGQPELDCAPANQHLEVENSMPTLELNDVFEIPNERVARIGTNGGALPGSRLKKERQVEVKIAELHEISSMTFALGARFAKKYSSLSDLEMIWTSVAALCDRTERVAKSLIKKSKVPVSIEEIQRFREAAQFRLNLYKKPA